MKLFATVPKDWKKHFHQQTEVNGSWRWLDLNTDRIVLKSPDPNPWGKPFTVLLTADFGETREGRRYEKRGKIVLHPLPDDVHELSTVEREFRVGKVFLLDRPLLPAIVYSDGNCQVIYWVTPMVNLSTPAPNSQDLNLDAKSQFCPTQPQSRPLLPQCRPTGV